jgi:hypothetical protein
MCCSLTSAPARKSANLLCFDARVAIREGDPDRAIENYIAVLHLARQCNQEPFLISRLVGIAIHELCISEFQWAVREDRKSLSLEHLTRLAHTHALLEGSTRMGAGHGAMDVPGFSPADVHG